MNDKHRKGWAGGSDGSVDGGDGLGGSGSGCGNGGAVAAVTTVAVAAGCRAKDHSGLYFLTEPQGMNE